MFSRNTCNAKRNEVLEELNISEEAETDKYLGLTVYVGRSRTKTFKYIKDIIWKSPGVKIEDIIKSGEIYFDKGVCPSHPRFCNVLL
jgi:hypothetical protein